MSYVSILLAPQGLAGGDLLWHFRLLIFFQAKEIRKVQAFGSNEGERGRPYFEASNVISDPKCNKGPNCNNFWPQM